MGHRFLFSLLCCFYPVLLCVCQHQQELKEKQNSKLIRQDGLMKWLSFGNETVKEDGPRIWEKMAELPKGPPLLSNSRRDLAVELSTRFMSYLMIGSSFRLETDSARTRMMRAQPELFKGTVELIEHFGYPAESHVLESPDGYSLILHRIPRGRRSSGKGRPVILHHGLLMSSSAWVINGPNKSLAFLLADLGYDVWMPNSRGNKYCRKHATRNVDDRDFWNFSFDDIADKDLPMTLDYILKETGHRRLSYVGHSMGGSVIFALLATRPEYNKKVRVICALAPALTGKYSKSGLKQLVPLKGTLQSLFNVFGVNEFFPNNPTWAAFQRAQCLNPSDPLCQIMFESLGGWNPDQLDMEKLPVYQHHFPGGSSTKTFMHYLQIGQYGTFQKYDYGAVNNHALYGQTFPPVYNISNVRAPVAFFHGVNDLLVDSRDVIEMSASLPSSLGAFHVHHPNWTHLDFLWAKDQGPLLNSRVIDIIKRF